MFTSRFEDLKKAVECCEYSTQSEIIDQNQALESSFKMIRKAQFQGGIIYVIGNGGSAGIASHFSTDLIKCLKIPSQTLYDSNMMTCLSNDLGYENVFSYPLEKLLRPQDLLVAISSSGKSQNIVQAADVAIRKKVPLITLSGFSKENPLKKLGQLNFWINEEDYGLVETAHFFLLHTIVDLWNQLSVKENEYAKIFRNAKRENQVLSGN